MNNNQATIFIVFLILILILSIVLIIMSSLSLQGINLTQGGNKRASGGSRLDNIRALLSEEDFKQLENFTDIDILYKKLGDTEFPNPSLNDVINEQSRESLLHNIQLTINYIINTYKDVGEKSKKYKIMRNIRDKLLKKYDELEELIECAQKKQEVDSLKLAEDLAEEFNKELEERKRQEELDSNKFFAYEQPHSAYEQPHSAYEQPHSLPAEYINILHRYNIQKSDVIEKLIAEYSWHIGKITFNKFMEDKFNKFNKFNTWVKGSLSFEDYCGDN